MQSNTLTLAKRAFAAMTVACLVTVFIAGTTSAGIQGSGFMRLSVYGRITGFGSIIVNGVEYDTTNARISLDGRPADQSRLRVGQIVTLTGSLNAEGTTGIADDVSVVGDLRGSITALDNPSHSFSVLGQTVRTTDETLGDARELHVGMAVEVSGFRNAAGDIVASRVDADDLERGAQIRGAIRALDRNAGTFMIDTLLVDYQNASLDGALAENAVVIVRGRASAGLVTARRVQVVDALGAADGQGDIEGIVTSFASAAEFDLNGQRVVCDEHTEYELSHGALGPDTLVRVKGRFSAGVLLADKVETKSN